MKKSSNEEIQRCREVPIHLLVGDARINRRVTILCPLHRESTPSCNLFPTGGYKCYGCENSKSSPNYGNSIDFLMRIGASFEEAVEELKKYI